MEACGFSFHPDAHARMRMLMTMQDEASRRYTGIQSIGDPERQNFSSARQNPAAPRTDKSNPLNN